MTTQDELPMLIDAGLTFRLTGIANRLNRSASAFYRGSFGIGVQEWRLVLVLGRAPQLTVGEAALAADIDTASASRALKSLSDNDYVTLELTSTRGRATFARLTDKGRALFDEVSKAGAQRAATIADGLSAEELAVFNALLGRILGNIKRLDAAG